MADDLKLVELGRDRAALRRFLRVPFTIYRDDPHWVAPLLSDRYKVLGPDNPFFSHARLALWTVARGGRDVGSVAGIVDDQHNAKLGERTAFFGFFESVDDPAVSRLLLDAVKGWASGLGMTRLLGPLNPSINEECGLLVEGFDAPPAVMTTYNPPYYERLLAEAGLRRAKELVSYLIFPDESHLARLERLGARSLSAAGGVTVRPIVKRRLLEDLAKIQAVYNAAWEENWGHVPMTSAEVTFMAERLLPLIDEKLVLIAERGDTTVGFALAVPDVNEALRRLRGRLASPRLALILPYLAGLRRPRTARLVAMGVVREHRRRGIETAMLAPCVRAMLRAGYRRIEVSWILDDNRLARSTVEAFGGTVFRRHALYEGPIEARPRGGELGRRSH